MFIWELLGQDVGEFTTKSFSKDTLFIWMFTNRLWWLKCSNFFFLVEFHMLSMLWSKVLFEKTGKRVVLISQAYRAGVIWRASSQYFLNENYGRHLWFYGQWRAGEKKKFIPRRRSTVENEKRCGGWRSEWYWPLPFTSCEWPRQNFSLLYLCNIMQTSDENKEKYQLWDY